MTIEIKDCVSDKIPILMNEGMEQEQAIAAAYSMCEGRALETIPPDEIQSAIDAYRQTQKTGEQPVFKSIYFPGGALKALGDGRIGGYLVVFTGPDDRDSYNEYFTARTDYGLEYYRNQPVLFHHGQNDEMVTPIGAINALTVTDTGIYAEAKLDMFCDDPTIRQYAQMAYNQVSARKLFWSSGSADHLVRITDDGEIVQWYIVEGSLTPKPAEQRGRTQVDILRAAIRALIEDEQTTLAEEPETVREPDVPASVFPTIRDNRKKKMSLKMDMASVMTVLDGSSLTPEQKWELATALAQAEAGEDMGEAPTMAEGAPAAPPEEEKPPVMMREYDAKETARQLLQMMKTAPAQPLPGGGGQSPAAPKPPANQIVLRTKYADLSAEDMAFLSDRRRLMAMRQGYQYAPEVPFMKELVDKVQKSYHSGGLKSLEDGVTNRILAIKTDELDNTAFAGAALEWVPTLWTSDLWRRVRVDNNIASSIRSIEMPSKSYELPYESTDPTVYKVPETTNETQLALDNSNNPIPDSKVASGKKTLTAVKLGLRVGFSDEMEEDSIIPWIPQTREQSLRTMMNAIDNVVINGDTETGASTNINDIAGTPAVTDKFLVFDGFRKLALVTNSAMAVNGGGANITLALIRSARFKMQSASNVYSLYPQNLVMFCDPYTYGKVLGIDELNVWMNNGRSASVNTGQVPLIDGVELFPSQELLLTNTAGKRDEDTLTNNTVGTFVIAARQGWTLGYRRQVTTSVDFLPYYDSYQFVATVRLALVYQDTVAASVIYNLAV